MAPKAALKAVPKKQSSLFQFGGTNFKLKVYQHMEKDEYGNDVLVSNKVSSSKPDCVEHVLDDSELRNIELRKKLEKEKAKEDAIRLHEANLNMRAEEAKKRLASDLDLLHDLDLPLLNETQPLVEHQEEDEESDEEREDIDDVDINVREEEDAIPTEAQRTNPQRLTLRLNLRK